MREETAEKVADLVIGAAALGVADFVLRIPALRRLAVRLAVTTLTVTLPGWFAREARQAWIESERRTI